MTRQRDEEPPHICAGSSCPVCEYLEPKSELKALADHYALTMPDEYPYGFALYMAELALADREED